jgi:hypothetical protein
MWSAILERSRDPLQRARWRLDALRALLNSHRATAALRTPAQWARDEEELGRMVAEAKWTLEMLEAANPVAPTDGDPTDSGSH